MAKITLTVAGRDYDVACRDGDEARFRALAAVVDGKAAQAARGMGGMTEVRQLLFAALLLADELDGARQAQPPAPPSPPRDPGAAIAIERLAARAEALAQRLERGPAAS